MLVKPPVGFTVSVAPVTFASIVPPGALITAIPPLPITPWPWIVCSFVRVIPPETASMYACPVPLPL